MNTSILTDKIFVQIKMKEKLQEWKKEGEGFLDAIMMSMTLI